MELNGVQRLRVQTGVLGLEVVGGRWYDVCLLSCEHSVGRNCRGCYGSICTAHELNGDDEVSARSGRIAVGALGMQVSAVPGEGGRGKEGHRTCLRTRDLRTEELSPRAAGDRGGCGEVVKW